jgi:hypothetical protein
MPNPVEKRLATLPTMSKAALSDLWKQLFHSDPSSELRRDLMIPILGYRMQEQAFGSLRAVLRNDFASSVMHSRKEVIRRLLELRESDREHDSCVSGAIRFTS